MKKVNKLIPIIGMEVHVELSTKSKMFCGCPAEHFSVKPNTHTCPVCLGLPGALPVPNRKAVKWTQMLGLALGSKINTNSKFDRKHYFYPDLPKGYQISQYDKPLATGGWLEFPISNFQFPTKRVRIRRVHLEEDTGKLKHAKVKGRNVTLVDFNRSGVPLVEIVAEPDIHSAKQAVDFTKKLRRIIRYLGISDCDMEKGSMRLEANVSVGELKKQGNEKSRNKKTKKQLNSNFQLPTSKLPDYKVELKNINSFRFMEKAIDFEVKRQSVIILSGGKPTQETRGYDETKNETFSQRTKEEAQDYRYFPEPDIPPMSFTKKYISDITNKLPELPNEKRKKFKSRFKIPEQYIDVLIEERDKAEAVDKLFEKAIEKKIHLKSVASMIVNKGIDPREVEVKKIFSQIKAQSAKITDNKKLQAWIDQAIKELPQAVKDYRSGKTNAIAALIGIVMKFSKGKADANIVRELLEEKLE